MTWNKAHLADYQDFKGGSVVFGGSNGRITGKGKIKAGMLDFEDVYYMEELKHYNLFFLLQMYDKKNKVLFTDTDCLVLSPDFKLPNENQGNGDTTIKASAGCNWRNKRNTWDKVFKYNSGLKSKACVDIKDPLGRLKSEMAWVPKRNYFLFFNVQDNPHQTLKGKGIVDSGCSRHMTGNKACLIDYQDFNGGPVASGGSKGQITGKGKIEIRKLDFVDVYFVKELKHFNLFYVSQMCDKKNKVLFTDTDCLVLSLNF
nr:ribonuclease H-like domain-containing protein [Tanacetum cinerariifolium]